MSETITIIVLEHGAEHPRRVDVESAPFTLGTADGVDVRIGASLGPIALRIGRSERGWFAENLESRKPGSPRRGIVLRHGAKLRSHGVFLRFLFEPMPAAEIERQLDDVARRARADREESRPTGDGRSARRIAALLRPGLEGDDARGGGDSAGAARPRSTAQSIAYARDWLHRLDRLKRRIEAPPAFLRSEEESAADATDSPAEPQGASDAADSEPTPENSYSDAR